VVGGVLILAAVAAVLAAGGSVWLLVRDGHGRRQVRRARRLRRMAGVSALIVMGTLGALRPWYWDLGIAAAVTVGFFAVSALLHLLLRRPPAGMAATAAALGAVLLASGLVATGGTAVALDAASLAGGAAVPVDHGGPVLERAVVYQLFWGTTWTSSPPSPALAAARSFQSGLASSTWASKVVGGGFGVRSIVSGGCFVDATPAPRGSRATSIVAGVFPQEVRAVFTHHRPAAACPGTSPAAAPPVLPRDALVVVWLDPDTVYALGGVSVHGAVPWPGRRHGLAVAGLSDGYASWGLSSCSIRPSCRTLPTDRPPTYALSHEVVEGITNPYGRGWYADTPLPWSARYVLDHGPTALLHPLPPFPGEVSDLCETGPLVEVAARGIDGRVAGDVVVAPFSRPNGRCVG